MASHNIEVLSNSSPWKTEEAVRPSTMQLLKRRGGRLCSELELGLRLLSLGLTLAAVVVVGLDKETENITVSISSSFPTLHVPVTAKWQNMSSLVFFVASNGIACSYAAVALCFTAFGLGENIGLVLSILDAVMFGLLMSADGASAAVGVIAREGNSHLQWNEVCNVFSSFCNRMAAAFILSLSGSLLFLCLVVLNMARLHCKLKP